MTVFALMDEWIACTGHSDDRWLSLGLDVLDGWQVAARTRGLPFGQDHLAACLTALRAQRPLASTPDPVSLAVWFHHCADLDPAVLDRLAEVGGPALGVRVGWLVRGLAAGVPLSDDPAARLLHVTHRATSSPSHLARLRGAGHDQ